MANTVGAGVPAKRPAQAQPPYSISIDDEVVKAIASLSAGIQAGFLSTMSDQSQKIDRTAKDFYAVYIVQVF